MTEQHDLVARLRTLAKAYAGSAITTPLLSEQRGFMSRSGLMTDVADRIEALESRQRVLEAELAKLRTPEWFYNADDGEYTYGDVSDTVDDMGHEGVMRVGGAREVWKKWAAVRCVALDDEGDIDETEVVTFDTEDEALRCWPESLAKARRALAGDAP